MLSKLDIAAKFHLETDFTTHTYKDCFYKTMLKEEALGIDDVKNHRILEWFGLKRNLIDCLVPTSLPWARTSSTRPGGSPIQPGLERCQGGGIHSFSGQPVPVPHHLHSK